MKLSRFSIIALGLAITACTDSGPIEVLGNFEYYRDMIIM